MAEFSANNTWIN